MHVEVEELSEQQQSYIARNEAFIDRRQKIDTTTYGQPIGTLDGQGDPGTESGMIIKKLNIFIFKSKKAINTK